MKWAEVKRWLPPLIWAGGMLFLSRQQGEDTIWLSGQISRALAGLLARLGVSVDQEGFHAALRTAAHFGVYFIWAMLLCGALCARAATRSALLRRALGALMICVFAAAMDELQKKWVPGRHCSWDEAALNCAGALAGTAVRLAFIGLKEKRNGSA